MDLFFSRFDHCGHFSVLRECRMRLRFRVFFDFRIEGGEHIGGVLAGTLRLRRPVLRQLRRMRGPVDLLKLPDRHMRVNLSCFQVRMTKHRLNEACVRTTFEHQRRHRVPEHMA